jgi:hypothetical protein
MATNENPPLESRRVRTHPFTLTSPPTGARPARASAMETSGIGVTSELPCLEALVPLPVFRERVRVRVLSKTASRTHF